MLKQLTTGLGGQLLKQYLPKAITYLKDPGKLTQLVNDAQTKANYNKIKSALGTATDTLATMLRLLNAYAKGNYRDIPWRSLLSLTAVVLYFVFPIDAVPDFLAGIGLLDDVGLLWLVAEQIRSDLTRFQQWEDSQLPPPMDV